MQDTLLFFDQHQTVYPLYEHFQKELFTRFPESRIKVQKAQISYYNRHLYACVSFLKVKKKVDLSKDYFVLTLGLPAPLESDRVAAKPNRIRDGGQRILSSPNRRIWTKNYSTGWNRRTVLPNQSDSDKLQFDSPADFSK